MDAGEPRVRHRGFFLHSETTGESDAVEQENPEGFVIRVRIRRPTVPRHFVGRSHSTRTVSMANGRSRMDAEAGAKQADGYNASEGQRAPVALRRDPHTCQPG